MNSSKELLSTDSNIVWKVLSGLLNEQTQPNVLQFDLEFNQNDHQSDLLAEFESSSNGIGAKRDPQLLVKWMRYCWFRQELIHIADLKATHNAISDWKIGWLNQIRDKHQNPLYVYTIKDSIERAIQWDATHSVSIEASIKKLQKILIEIVTTEHPTDPLSQAARGILLEITDALLSGRADPMADLKKLMGNLQLVAPLPDKNRIVLEEVERNIELALSKLYDALPDFIDTILHAYQTYYPAGYKKYRSTIWRAFEGGLQKNGDVTTPIFCPAFWAGVDAEGNSNVTPDVSLQALTQYRVKCINKHLAFLDSRLMNYVDTIQNAHDRELISTLLKGFKLDLISHREFILKNPAAKPVIDDSGTPRDPSEYLFNKIKFIYSALKNFLPQYPILKNRLRHFRVLLGCFGATYAKAHLRQDAPVHEKVWDRLIEDLKQNAEFNDNALVAIFRNQSYSELSTDIRFEFHKLLLSNISDAQQILNYIKLNFDSGYYLSSIFGDVETELKRYQLIVNHDDMIDNAICSNTHCAANVLEVESFIRIFTNKPVKTRVVPLVESRDNINNIFSIIETLFLNTKQTHFEVMLGYSDSQNKSGIATLLSLSHAKHRLHQLAKKLNITIKVHDGTGTELSRFGPRSRFQKSTLQGIGRVMMLNKLYVQRYLAGMFYHAHAHHSKHAKSMKQVGNKKYIHHVELNKPLSLRIQKWLNKFEKQGAVFYEKIHDTKEGFGKILGFMLGAPNWLAVQLNNGSRAMQRLIPGQQDELTQFLSGEKRFEQFIDPAKPRAISSAQLKELLRQYLNLILGPGYALRKLGVKRAERLYDVSEVVRDIVHKLIFGFSMSDLSITAAALFANNPDFYPADKNIIKTWIEECKTTLINDLKLIDVEKLSKTPEGIKQLMPILAKFFVFIEHKYKKTKKFIFELHSIIHSKSYHQQSHDHPLALLHHDKKLHQQMGVMRLAARPISLVIARMTHAIRDGRKLTELYFPLGYSSHQYTAKSLVYTLAAASAAVRLIPFSYIDDYWQDAHPDMRPGVTRAEIEAQLYPTKLAHDTVIRNFLENHVWEKRYFALYGVYVTNQFILFKNDANHFPEFKQRNDMNAQAEYKKRLGIK